MPAAVLTIKGDATSVLRTFAQVSAVGHAAAALISRDFASAAKAAGDAWIAANRQIARGFAERRRTQETVARAGEQAERAATQVAVAEGNYRTNANKREADEAKKAADDVARARERAEKQATAASIRESNRRAALDRQREREERARARARERSIDSAMRTASGVGSMALGGLNALSDFGDDVRARNRAREQVEMRAMSLAAGDVGDPRAARQIMAATRSVAEATGMDPTAVMEGISTAQQRFSVLNDPRQRQSYLTNVLPMLARASLVTGSSLEDMVSSAGEFQRQMGIGNDQMPHAIAAMIQQGRLGSVSFGDMARHMGAIGGSAMRFLSNDPSQSAGNLAAVGALFQTAAQGGGGGDVAATRTRGFLSNFTSARGQQRLESLLGRHVFGASGEIIAHAGESSSAAFQRTIEEAFARSHGNATQFLTGVGGNNQRSREVADQLMRDMRAHGGHLSGFAGLLSGGEAGVDPAFAAIAGTAAVRRARQENRTMFSMTGGRYSFAGQTDQQLRDLQESNPLLASVLSKTPGASGILDLANIVGNRGDASAAIQPGGQARTRADLIHDLAQRRAVEQEQQRVGPFAMFMSADRTRANVAQFTREIEQQMTARDRAAGRDANAPIRIDPSSTIELGPTSLATIRQSGGKDPHDRALANSIAASNPGGARR